jgi:hypothetical protein
MRDNCLALLPTRRRARLSAIEQRGQQVGLFAARLAQKPASPGNRNYLKLDTNKS